MKSADKPCVNGQRDESQRRLGRICLDIGKKEERTCSHSIRTDVSSRRKTAFPRSKAMSTYLSLPELAPTP